MSEWPGQIQLLLLHSTQGQAAKPGSASVPLRGHAGDVQDIAWAPDSSALMSGSVENICIMWDVEGASRKCRLEDHRNYVQVDSGYATWGISCAVLWLWSCILSLTTFVCCAHSCIMQCHTDQEISCSCQTLSFVLICNTATWGAPMQRSAQVCSWYLVCPGCGMGPSQ